MLDLEVKEQGQILNPNKARQTSTEVEAEIPNREEEIEDGEEIPSMPFGQAICVRGVM